MHCKVPEPKFKFGDLIITERGTHSLIDRVFGIEWFPDDGFYYERKKESDIVKETNKEVPRGEIIFAYHQWFKK